MAACSPEFVPLLADFQAEHLQQHAGTVYGLWPDLSLAYHNDAWQRFAAENGGEPAISAHWNIGCCIADAIAPPLRPFYTKAFDRCLKSAEPWVHTYECSSGELFRLFHLTAFPLGNGQAILVVNSLHVQHPHDPEDRPPASPAAQVYTDQEGLLHQCCHCRRTRHAHKIDRWDWVPAWVDQPQPNTSHAVCPICADFYYPGWWSDAETP